MDSLLKIFVLEDDDIIRFGIEAVLKKAGFSNVNTAQSLEEANDLLEHFVPDVAVIDITLSGLNEGFLVAEKLGKLKVPFFFLTGNSSSEIISQAIELKPIAYLIKPIDMNELIANITLYIRNAKRIGAHSSSQFVKSVNGYISLIIDEILYISTQNVYIEVHLKSGKKVVLRHFIDKFLAELSAPQLIKVHRSFAINTLQITSFNGRYIMLNDVRIPISKTHKKNLFDQISILESKKP